MVKINELPPRLRALAYRQFFSRGDAEKHLKLSKAKSFFRVRKEIKPDWYSSEMKWKQTYTLVPIRRA